MERGFRKLPEWCVRVNRGLSGECVNSFTGFTDNPAVNRDILSLARQVGFDELESEDIEDFLTSHTEEFTNEDLQLLTEHSPIEDDDNKKEPQRTLTSKRRAESFNMF
ncbi:putative Tigger transposable element-derived protein 1-like 278 [Homarus americanus]|uniref:Putative Tigger transposable element-derived protein 1-like 278 n=1 Tax=Homarus americanus TaxID=6706 RepID=A0A8J5NB15_HOMAM|nr:putative Tigger transposable element-derived protein 1-like 278 [Homarus americanus]